MGLVPGKLGVFSSINSASSLSRFAKSSSVASPEQIASFILVSSGRGVPLLSPLQSRNSPASHADYRKQKISKKSVFICFSLIVGWKIVEGLAQEISSITFFWRVDHRSLRLYKPVSPH